MPNQYDIDCFVGCAGITRLRNDWQALLQGRDQYAFYHHPVWFDALQAHLISEPLQFVRLRADGHTMAIIPLVRLTNAKGGATYGTCAHEHIVLSDWILASFCSPHQLLAVLPAVLKVAGGVDWARLILCDVPEGGVASALHQALQVPGSERIPPFTSTLRSTRYSAWFDCCSDSSPVPAKLRRNHRRLRKHYPATELELVTSAAAINTAYEHFLTVESSGWKGEDGTHTAIAQSPKLEAFYRALLVTDTPGFTPSIHLLWFEDKPVAAQFALRTPGLLSLLKIGFDEAYAQLAPGSLLLESVLDAAVQDPLLHRVSLVTSPQWAARWHPSIADVHTCRVFNNTTTGMALHGMDTLRAHAEGVYRELTKGREAS